MIILFVLFFLYSNCLSAFEVGNAAKIMTSISNVDWSCLKPQVPTPCAEPAPGIYLRYWEPSLVMETVQSGGQWQSVGTSSMHFHEVHVYDFPSKLPQDVIACPSIPNFTLGRHYFTENDWHLWRSADESKDIKAKMAAQFSTLRIGQWGPLFPRSGFMVHTIPAVSSALNALRAVSISSMEPPWGHMIEAPLDFQMNLLTDKMQMVYPQKSMCMAPGTDPRLWAQGKNSRDGNYVWIYWRYRECCKPILPPV